MLLWTFQITAWVNPRNRIAESKGMHKYITKLLSNSSANLHFHQKDIGSPSLKKIGHIYDNFSEL